jgi:hypothetical protein
MIIFMKSMAKSLFLFVPIVSFVCWRKQAFMSKGWRSTCKKWIIGLKKDDIYEYRFTWNAHIIIIIWQSGHWNDNVGLRGIHVVSNRSYGSDCIPKSFAVDSLIRGYHVYRVSWTTTLFKNSELKTEHENIYDDHAVAIM